MVTKIISSFLMTKKNMMAHDGRHSMRLSLHAFSLGFVRLFKPDT